MSNKTFQIGDKFQIVNNEIILIQSAPNEINLLDLDSFTLWNWTGMKTSSLNSISIETICKLANKDAGQIRYNGKYLSDFKPFIDCVKAGDTYKTKAGQILTVIKLYTNDDITFTLGGLGGNPFCEYSFSRKTEQEMIYYLNGFHKRTPLTKK